MILNDHEERVSNFLNSLIPRDTKLSKSETGSIIKGSMLNPSLSTLVMIQRVLKIQNKINKMPHIIDHNQL